jgi:hypothetical protein
LMAVVVWWPESLRYPGPHTYAGEVEASLASRVKAGLT